MKSKIRLETQSDILKLVGIATSIGTPVYLTDNNDIRVSAKSMLGTTYAKFEFSEIWLECDGEHYFAFRDFIVED